MEEKRAFKSIMTGLREALDDAQEEKILELRETVTNNPPEEAGEQRSIIETLDK